MAAVGIDLGTTNTVVGHAHDGQAYALRDPDGECLIPSVVSFHSNGSVLVGRTAKERRVVDAANTIYSVKRLIGRSFSSEEVLRSRERLPFEMREGPGQAVLAVARGETFTLPEISAFVLRQARTVAEKAIGQTVEQAVITVPANFNDLQRAATKVAGRVAGLEVLRILNEPTAAALAYGYGSSRGERIAIYDFGGGTFDVTLLDLTGDVFEVLATAGNTFLGGDDIDLLVAERMADVCKSRHSVDAHDDPQIFERLRYYAEKVKVDLSTAEQASVEVPDVGPGPGGKPIRLSFSMSRRELEDLARPIVDATFEVCTEALTIARLNPEDFDQVVLVGGSTRLPIVRSNVNAFFGRPPLDRINPDEVVGIGAAIQAAALAGPERRRSTIPKPPMPAARSLEAAVGAAKNLRKTDPFGGRGGTLPLSTAEGAGPPGQRRRVITGMGLGPPPLTAAPPRAQPVHELPSLDEALDGDFTDAEWVEDDSGAPEPAPKGAVPSVPRMEQAPAAARARPPAFAATQLGIASPPASPPATSEFDLEFSPAAPPVQRFTAEPRERAPLPLLVDVTPLSLSVETVGGFCDVIITRNTPLPGEQSRTFVTAQDGQATVVVRVGQGESVRFSENTLLGELELSELRPAPRGELHVVVSFALDTDGMLEVRAVDAETSRAATARLKLVGLPDADDVDRMTERHHLHPGS